MVPSLFMNCYELNPPEEDKAQPVGAFNALKDTPLLVCVHRTGRLAAE